MAWVRQKLPRVEKKLLRVCSCRVLTRPFPTKGKLGSFFNPYRLGSEIDKRSALLEKKPNKSVIIDFHFQFTTILLPLSI